MRRLLTLSLLGSLCLLAALPAQAQTVAGLGNIPAPQFTPGLVLRYQLDIGWTHDVEVAGVVENPQGGRQLSVRFAAALQLAALEPRDGEPQVRATAEHVSVVIDGDTFDPSVAAIERRYRQLEGYSATLGA